MVAIRNKNVKAIKHGHCF